MRVVVGFISVMCHKIELKTLNGAPRQLSIQVSKQKESVIGRGLFMKGMVIELSSVSCQNNIAGASLPLACGWQAISNGAPHRGNCAS